MPGLQAPERRTRGHGDFVHVSCCNCIQKSAQSSSGNTRAIADRILGASMNWEQEGKTNVSPFWLLPGHQP